MRRLSWLLSLVIGLLVSVPVPAVEPALVNKAMDKGVEALRRMQTANGTWPCAEMGATSLAGLTLLECGVPAEDRAVQQAVKAVRNAAVTETRTYSLSLSILFLDRLGDANDLPLIESLGVRLMAGQRRDGGWAYACPSIGESEVRRLTNHLRKSAELVGRRTLPDRPGTRRTVQDLPQEIQQQLLLINRQQQPDGNECDNSNTQFATLALWVCRRHGLPVEAALGRVEAHFRTTQQRNGGWGYGRGVTQTTAAMTCSGCLGLTVAHGTVAALSKERDPNALPPDLGRDVALKAGLAALSTAVGHPISGRRVAVPAQMLAVDGRAYYSLWSLERVMVALGLETLAGKDWYNWGAELLLVNQAADGSWRGEFASTGADTCFALLFLRRANLAKDLTANLRGKLKDQSIVLKSGGVGGEGLRGPLKEPLEPAEKDKPPHTPPDQAPKDPQATVKEPGNPVKEPMREPANPPRPPPPQGSESARIARELLQTPPGQMERALEQVREARGVVYTEALADAIPQLTGDHVKKAREALAARLTRMKTETLGSYLKDPDTEIRRAAALACAMKDCKVHIPNLIPLLSDPQTTVARAAHVALRELTGQNFGASRETWQQWWDKQKN